MLSVYEQAIEDKKANQFVTLNTEETVPRQTVSSVQS
jgi:hypothetical protein